MVAVDAAAPGGGRCEPANDRVILLGGGGVGKAQQRLQVLQPAHAGHHRQNTGSVQRILEALVAGHGGVEGRGGRIQQFAAMEGLHHRDADPHGLAPAEQRRPLRNRADAQLVPLFQVIGRVDGEHHHIHKAGVQHAVGHRRGVGGKPDVPHPARRLLRLNVVQHAGAEQFVQIRVLVHAVEEAEVRVVGAEGRELPFKGPADQGQVPGPAVLAFFIVHRPEMQLKEHPVPLPGDAPAKRRVHIACPGAQVKKVDAPVDGGADHLLDLRVRCLLDAAHSQPQRAEFFLFASVGKLSVFHSDPRFPVIVYCHYTAAPGTGEVPFG